MMEFTLRNAPSLRCTLLHNGDDLPRKVYFATDEWNGCNSRMEGWPCFMLRIEGETEAPIRPWAGYYIACF